LENRSSASKLNKATISSWLIFIYKALNEGTNLNTVIEFYDQFETLRESHEGEIGKELIPNGITQSFLVKTIQIYQDRASSRVADTSSVILRDIILWGIYSLFNQNPTQPNNGLSPLNLHLHYLSSQKDISFSEISLSKIAKDLRWGDVL
jgi:hypothetical protein